MAGKYVQIDKSEQEDIRNLLDEATRRISLTRVVLDNAIEGRGFLDTAAIRRHMITLKAMADVSYHLAEELEKQQEEKKV